MLHDWFTILFKLDICTYTYLKSVLLFFLIKELLGILYYMRRLFQKHSILTCTKISTDIILNILYLAFGVIYF